jgi:hypothetical protein
MPPKEQSLAVRIHSDPALREVVKLVGYNGIPTPIPETDYKRLSEKYGRERIGKASDELVEIDTTKKFATLKFEVRKLCQAILGPAPEAWDEFYRGITNPPRNPYRGEREEIDVVADTVATAIREETGMGCEVSREPKQPSPDTDKQPADLNTIRKSHGRRLRQLLFVEHEHYRHHAPSHPAHKEAVGRMDLLEAEMRRRGNKVPPRPVWKEPYTPPDDDEVPAAQEERNGSRHDKIGTAAAAFRPFAGHTTHRLRELLDMCEYEMAKNGPETVTYEEAARNMALIENELRQREQEGTAWIVG